MSPVPAPDPVSEAGGGGAVDPSTLSRFFSYAAPTGIASGGYAQTGLSWAPNATIVGADISVNGDVASTLDINTDGIYAVTTLINPFPDSGNLVDIDFTVGADVNGVVEEKRTFSAGDDPFITLGWTGFIPATEGVITLSALCTTDGGTWGVGTWNLWVQRVA